VAVEYRWAQGEIERLPSLVADLANRQVAVIAALRCSAWPFAVQAQQPTLPTVGFPLTSAFGVTERARRT
jgi:putative ABC transport system substrate-binding protein